MGYVGTGGVGGGDTLRITLDAEMLLSGEAKVAAKGEGELLSGAASWRVDCVVATVAGGRGCAQSRAAG